MNPRRRCLCAGGAALLLPGLGACAALVPAWEGELRDARVVLLGEVHDNAGLHGRRVASLQRALEAGWRPSLVMEQFDTDRQADIERSRRERPHDAAHLIAQASPSRSGWDWSLYEPVIALALRYELPLVAGNLPRADAARLVR